MPGPRSLPWVSLLGPSPPTPPPPRAGLLGPGPLQGMGMPWGQVYQRIGVGMYNRPADMGPGIP